MRFLFVVIITLLAVGQTTKRPMQTISRQEPQHNAAPKRAKNKNNNAQIEQILTTVQQLVAEIEAERKQERAVLPNPKFSMSGAYSANNILLTVFTGLLAVVAVLQWFAMREQATILDRQAGIAAQQHEIAERQFSLTESGTAALEKERQQSNMRYAEQVELAQNNAAIATQSADAAVLNAKAVMIRQRPWIEVSHQVTGDIPRKANIYFEGANIGRTPAEVVHHSAMYLPLANEDELPNDPPYYHTELKYLRLVAPMTSFPIGEGTFSLGQELLDDMWIDFNRNGQRLYFLGHVVYKDFIDGTEHETRFCYRLTSNASNPLILAGPRQYNMHT